MIEFDSKSEMQTCPTCLGKGEIRRFVMFVGVITNGCRDCRGLGLVKPANPITITPATDAVKPLPCVLSDPENAYTIEQVRENLIEMEAQLASYPVNLSRGPGWVRQQILSMLDRGIQP